MRYDLTRLGAQEFEELSQALAVAVLGDAVSIFGAGPDGGREAVFEGAVHYPEPTPPSGQWNGYGVLQAKFKRSTASTGDDTTWFLRELRKELDKWVDQNSGRVKNGRVPEYLVLATNVTLSAVPGTGGIDRVKQEIRRYVDHKGLALRDWAVWHHDQICRFLEVHDGVRRTYKAFVTAGDVLDEVQCALKRLRNDEIPDERFSDLLTLQAALELRGQQWVRLNQAGDPLNHKLQLSAVGIDLPGRAQSVGGPEVPGVIARIIEAGNRIRRPRPNVPPLPHVAIVGGPGQGKTTLGQLLCQIYRVALLADRPRHVLGPDVPDLLDQYRAHLRDIGLPLPECRRWPVRIALNEFADALAATPSTTLLEFAAKQANKAGPINRRMLREWLREWPWLVVLDGLDEVADSDTREKTLDAIGNFLVEAGHLEADLLVVATTRPQGYSDEFSPRHYEHLELNPMTPDAALLYAKNLAALQYAQDPEMETEVVRRLTAAAAETNTARLMRTPLQVTIMTLLLERQARVPQDRYSLFETYYNTLYDREAHKSTSIAQLLENHRRNIDRLHERVGLLLQVRSEHAGEAEAQLPEDELHEMAYRRLLHEEGFRAEEANRLAAQLVKAATDRLVMLVGRPNGTVGFEVRSLQELMAARALFEASEQDMLKSLTDLAPSAHWRNTWLFAASRLFAQHERLRNALVVLLEELDATPALSRYLMPGAQLAVDMLDEDITAAQPRYTKLLIQRALRLLDTSPGPPIQRLATVVHDAATVNAEVVHLGMDAINAKIAGRGKATPAALDALAAWAERAGNSSVSARSRLDRIKASTPMDLEPIIEELKRVVPRDVWFAYHTTIVRTEDKFAAPDLLQKISDALPEDHREAFASVAQRLNEAGGDFSPLADPSLQESLVRVLNELDPTQWALETAIRQPLNRWLAHRPADTTRAMTLVEPEPSG